MIVQVVAAFVADEGLAANGDSAVGVTFFYKETGEVVHGFPAHRHGLYAHDGKCLMEGGLGFGEFVKGHIDAGFIDEGQTGGIGGVGVADGEVAITKGVVILLVCEVSIADIGVGDALAVEDELV